MVVKDSEIIVGYVMGPTEYDKSPWKRAEEGQRETGRRNAAGFEDGERDPKPRNGASHLKLEEAGNIFSY